MFLELLVAGLCCMPHVGGFCCCHWLFDWRFDEFDAIRFAYFFPPEEKRVPRRWWLKVSANQIQLAKEYSIIQSVFWIF